MLIVEDDDALRNRLARAMRKRGFEVQAFASVAEGLEATQHMVPNFAVIDLRLADGSGLEIAQALQTKASEVRTVIVTGYGDIPTAVAAVRIGAIDYLSKPASADEIIDVLMTPGNENPPAPSDPISPDEARWKHIEKVFHEVDQNVSQVARLFKSAVNGAAASISCATSRTRPTRSPSARAPTRISRTCSRMPSGRREFRDQLRFLGLAADRQFHTGGADGGRFPVLMAAAGRAG